MTDKHPARKRWLIRIGLVLAVMVAILLLFIGIVNWRASRTIHAEMEALRAAGEPLNWDELRRTDRNGHVQPEGAQVLSHKATRLYTQALAKIRELKNAPDSKIIAQKDLSPKELTELGHALKKRREILNLLHQAAQIKGLVILNDFPIDPAKEMPGFADMRDAGRLLLAEARYASHSGDGDQAADACIALCGLAHSVPGEIMIGKLVNLAITSITCTTITQTQETTPASSGKMKELIAALALLQDDTPLVRMLCGERVFGSYIFQSNKSGGAGVSSLPKFVGRPNFSAYLALFRNGIAASRKPMPEARKEIEALVLPYAQKIGPRYTFTIFARMLAPTFTSATEQAARSQAQVRVTLTSLMLRQYVLDRNSLPASLDVLVPAYLEKIPLDPFTGKPLLYKRADTGCLIYSTGADRADNGGTEFGPNKQKYKPGTDIVIMLKNTE